MYRRYYSMNDMPQIACKQESKPNECEEKKNTCEKKESKKVLGNFELDDIILGIVILAILLDDADDTLLLLALFTVFFTGHI